MSCGCSHSSRNGAKTSANDRPTRPTPTTQCLLCAQKHADEALIAMREFTYDIENRSFIHGSLRAIVLHTYKAWRDVAETARNAALAWQGGDKANAEKLLVNVIKLIYEKLDFLKG